MKIPARPSASSARGFTLIECLVYISVLAVVLAVGSMGFYRCWDDNKAITRNGNDIVRALKAGEAWRADMRSATGPVQITTTNSKQTMRIPCRDKEVIYSFANGEVRKQAGRDSNLVLPKVKSSQMQIEKRDQVTAWRWEVELEPQHKNAKMRPLFTFEAVAGNSFAQ